MVDGNRSISYVRPGAKYMYMNRNAYMQHGYFSFSLNKFLLIKIQQRVGHWFFQL